MFGKTVSKVSQLFEPMLTHLKAARISGRAAKRVGSSILRPKGTPVSRSFPVKVQPILKPILVSLTPALKRAPNTPSAEGNVVVLDPTIFKHPMRRDILHLCAVHHLDGLRQGSANTKTRGEVAGSGIKIRRQKGSGKARLGDAQSPMLRGGGVAFGPKPRDFSTKLPRKVVEMGFRVILSSKLREQRLGVMTRIGWPNGKTRTLSQRINALGLRKTLFVTGEQNVHEGLQRAIRNIPLVDVVTAQDVNVYELIKWERVILDIKAVDFFEKALKKDIPTMPLPLLEAAELTSSAEA